MTLSQTHNYLKILSALKASIIKANSEVDNLFISAEALFKKETDETSQKVLESLMELMKDHCEIYDLEHHLLKYHQNNFSYLEINDI